MTLLKLIDCYLQSAQHNAMSIVDILETHQSLGSFLSTRFFLLSSYSQQSIARALGTQPITTEWNPLSEQSTTSTSPPNSSASDNSGSSSASASTTTFPLLPPAELDAKLPTVCEALVLLTQCIVTICLETEEQQMRVREGLSNLRKFTNMKNYFIQKRSSNQGMVESLIGL